MTNQIPTSNEQKPHYDLEERTAKFGEAVLLFCRSLQQDTVTQPLIHQLVRSATSVGANYMEADAASTKRDFVYKISICRKEAKETRHWLRMISTVLPSASSRAAELSRESQELVFIFSAIIR